MGSNNNGHEGEDEVTKKSGENIEELQKRMVRSMLEEASIGSALYESKKNPYTIKELAESGLKLSHATIERVRRIIDNNSAILRTALVVAFICCEGMMMSTPLLNETLRTLEMLSKGAEYAYTTIYDVKHKAEVNKFNKMRRNKKIDTIYDLEELLKYGYDIYKIFGISRATFEDLRKIEDLHWSAKRRTILFGGEIN